MLNAQKYDDRRRNRVMAGKVAYLQIAISDQLAVATGPLAQGWGGIEFAVECRARAEQLQAELGRILAVWR